MKNNTKLYILWTNSDLHTSKLMVLMYAKNSLLKGWWEEVTVIIWGATAKIAAENEAIQEEIKLASHAGVKFSACQACAEQLGVSEKLKELGLEIKYWGAPLTELIKNNENLITV